MYTVRGDRVEQPCLIDLEDAVPMNHTTKTHTYTFTPRMRGDRSDSTPSRIFLQKQHGTL